MAWSGRFPIPSNCRITVMFRRYVQTQKCATLCPRWKAFVKEDNAYVRIEVWPGLVIEIMPNHEHMVLLSSVKAGMLAIKTSVLPGVQGIVGIGRQGWGFKTPWLAVVAAAVSGLVSVVQLPKGGIFTIGLKSIILAAGWFSSRIRLSGKTVNPTCRFFHRKTVPKAKNQAGWKPI